MKKLVIQNINDQFGRFMQQSFGVWENKRRAWVLPPDTRKDARQRAENYIAQLELDLERDQ